MPGLRLGLRLGLTTPQAAQAAQGDDMASQSLALSLAQINAAATPTGALAALTFSVTDAIDLTTVGFKTTIDAATDTAALNALRLLVGQPWPSQIGGTTITIAGTAGYNGVHEIASNGIVSNGGKLAFKTTTVLGGTESGLTATAVFTKLAQFGFAMPALPATSIALGVAINNKGTKAAGATAINARIGYLKANGAIGAVGNLAISLVATDRASSDSSGGLRGWTATGEAPADRASLWAVFDLNQEAGKQLDDVTGLDSGISFTSVYVDVPGIA